MKNRIISVLIISVFSFTSIAQKFDGGVMLGLVGSQVAGDLYGGFNKAGVNAGGWTSLSVSPKSEFRMELAYIQKGSRENPDPERDRYDTYIMRLGYIELPFLYRYIYNERFEFETGLGFNFLIHQGESFNGYETTESPFKGQNLCFLAGISFSLNDNVRIGFRTDNSLFSIRKNRVTGDVWRFWDHGQFSDALVLSAYYRL
ncbi:MAG: hypothetical protein CVU14_08220 [Bacteroidetes bacterium HGW-Bacteroidetes-9]|jgi:hypothetical protein|nr:MAG: hypothetical protein CVU14_08220 [Bacteroidetes bacterium HGW-Bacteroidetes-9]